MKFVTIKNISINQGDSLYLTLSKYNDEGDEVGFNPTDILKLTAKRNLNQKTYDIESKNARIVDGKAIIELAPSQTNIRLGDYYYDIEYQNENLDRYTLVKGTLTVEWDVTD